jgi:Ca2+-dependent lipid-binding protein
LELIRGSSFAAVWVELRGIVGTMRLRIELVAEYVHENEQEEFSLLDRADCKTLHDRPPFVKHATISFMGLPKVEISAIPMIETGIKLNAMNLPLISTFISNSINTAIDEYGTLSVVWFCFDWWLINLGVSLC